MCSRSFFGRLIVAALAVTSLSFSVTDKGGKMFTAYSKDELRYFKEVAFLNGRLARWRTPIIIEQEGGFDSASTARVRQIVDGLRPLLGEQRIALSTQRGNLLIHYPSTLDDYTRHLPEKGTLPLGFTIPRFSASNNLVHVDIYLHPSLLADKKGEVLKHEICHALGLLDHATTPYSHENLLGIPTNSGELQGRVLPQLDQAALKLLYDERLGANFREKDFDRKAEL